MRVVREGDLFLMQHSETRGPDHLTTFDVFVIGPQVINFADPFVMAAKRHRCKKFTQLGVCPSFSSEHPTIELELDSKVILRRVPFTFDSHRQEYHVGDAVYVWCERFKMFYQTAVVAVVPQRHVVQLSANLYDAADQFVSVEKVFLKNWKQVQANCRRTVYAWLLCSACFKFGEGNKRWFPKDMRRLIAQYVWKSRNESDWDDWKF